ncbi:class I adenylate-forming enzyme family protein [Streptomyces sioyaensis]|uniref:class I adenylate-forming enzyme family protein n=1 Tax=Streptomyces sioyaensis TaxID=67364 RepID=UPI0037D137F0
MADLPHDLPDRVDQLLARAAAAHPEHPAIIVDGAQLTYGTLNARVDSFAAVLQDLTAVGEVVAVASVLHPDFAVAYHAAARAGRTVAVVNPLLREADLLHVLSLANAAVAVVDATLEARVRNVLDQLPGLRKLLRIGALPSGVGTPANPDGEPGDIAVLQFTSGTTGRPKAVRLSHRNVVVNAAQVVDAHRLDNGTVALNHLPTYHPMHLNSAFAAGATQVLCAAPEPLVALMTANRYDATIFYSLPVRLARLAADPDLDSTSARSLQRIASGGSGLPVAAARRLSQRFCVPVFQGYGLAETSPLTHSDDPDRPVHGSVGRPVVGTECRIVDIDTRTVLPAHSVGEVQLRGPQVMRGYAGGPDGTGLEPDGWLNTGDVGRIDEDGRLFLVDRLKDVFKCDNFMVAPSDVERALLRDPRVMDAVVVELQDDTHGAVAGALVVLREPSALRDVVADINDELPYYQHVRDAMTLDTIPRSGNGKVQRRLLAEQLTATRPPESPEENSTPPVSTRSHSRLRPTPRMPKSIH